MIWKDSTKVAFGRRLNVIVAWYCDDPATVDSPSDAVDNITETCIGITG
jgi:hypothetical protein